MANIVQTDATDPAEAARRRAVLALHVAIAVPLTTFAALLCERTRDSIRLVQPGYPREVTVGIYTPSPAYQLIHAIGPAGLVALLAVAIGLSIALGRARTWATSGVMTVVAALHAVLLGAALAGYALSVVQLSGLLRVLLR
jgi:hypothetical protein